MSYFLEKCEMFQTGKLSEFCPLNVEEEVLKMELMFGKNISSSATIVEMLLKINVFPYEQRTNNVSRLRPKIRRT